MSNSGLQSCIAVKQVKYMSKPFMPKENRRVRYITSKILILIVCEEDEKVSQCVKS